MSSFFTNPSAPKKRKHSTSEKGATKRTKTSKATKDGESGKKKSAVRDEDISSESEDGGRPALSDEEDEDEDFSHETPAERRLRLAQQYLDNLKADIEQDTIGFDAAEIDKEIIGARLKESVAESKGRIYRRLASNFQFSDVTSSFFCKDTKTMTGIATCAPFVYTVSKGKHLIKWDCSGEGKPKIAARYRGAKKSEESHEGHIDEILCVAASGSGKFVATGGKDRRIVIWDPETLQPLKVFKQHRGSVYGLVFRRGTNQMYSCSADRTCKVWSLDELAYVETLFGHQDEVLGITALGVERCVTVGARDRTARLWKIVDETQLVFRGGGESKKRQAGFMEGSMDCVSMVDEEHFITGSDNGSISFWSINKKKPIHTIPIAHGLNPPLQPSEYSAEQDPDPNPPCPPQPREITALKAIPFSDLFFSGSYDGYVRIWKISDDKKKVIPLGRLGIKESDDLEDNPEQAFSGSKEDILVKGVINGIDVFDSEDKKSETLTIAVCTGKEMRLGRWMKGEGKNGGMIFRVQKKSIVDTPLENNNSR